MNSFVIQNIGKKRKKKKKEKKKEKKEKISSGFRSSHAYFTFTNCETLTKFKNSNFAYYNG